VFIFADVVVLDFALRSTIGTALIYPLHYTTCSFGWWLMTGAGLF
jgi:hypothetical protein